MNRHGLSQTCFLSRDLGRAGLNEPTGLQVLVEIPAALTGLYEQACKQDLVFRSAFGCAGLYEQT
jgi:hypothetical protein